MRLFRVYMTRSSLPWTNSAVSSLPILQVSSRSNRSESKSKCIPHYSVLHNRLTFEIGGRRPTSARGRPASSLRTCTAPESEAHIEYNIV